MVPPTEATCSLFLPLIPITFLFPCSKQLSQPCSCILNHQKKREVTILSGHYLQKGENVIVVFTGLLLSVTAWFFSFSRIRTRRTHQHQSVLGPQTYGSWVLNTGAICQQHKRPKDVPTFGAPGPLGRSRIMTRFLQNCYSAGCSSGEPSLHQKMSAQYRMVHMT